MAFLHTPKLLKAKDKGRYRYMTPFPVELWIPILTEAIRPSGILETSCVSSNMEEYYQAVAGDINQACHHPETDNKLITRTAICLVCRQFNEIMKRIPKGPSHWLLVDNNEPRYYRAPIPRWSTSRQYERIDLRLDFERTTHIAASYTPVTVFRLHVRRTSQPSDPLYEQGVVISPSHILQHPERLRVLHLYLDCCFCTDPAEFVQSLSTFTLLTTLSLCVGTSNLRDIIYEPLSLPNLHVFFLELTVYGVRETALQTWVFPSLNILSLNLRIARRGVDPVPSMPEVISSFIIRHNVYLYGLRIQPGPWSRPRNDRYLLPMEPEAEQKFKDSLSGLKALSTDFTYFPLTNPETSQDSKLPNLLKLVQLGVSLPSILLQGLTQAIEACDSLREIDVPYATPSWYIDALETQEIQSLRLLRELCSRRNILLCYR